MPAHYGHAAHRPFRWGRISEPPEPYVYDLRLKDIVNEAVARVLFRAVAPHAKFKGGDSSGTGRTEYVYKPKQRSLINMAVARFVSERHPHMPSLTDAFIESYLDRLI